MSSLIQAALAILSIINSITLELAIITLSNL